MPHQQVNTHAARVRRILARISGVRAALTETAVR